MKNTNILTLVLGALFFLFFGCQKEEFLPRDTDSYGDVNFRKEDPKEGIIPLWRGWAYGINEAGQVAGYRSDFSGSTAMLWDGEQARELWTGFATAINEKGAVIGNCSEMLPRQTWNSFNLWAVMPKVLYDA